MSLIEQAAKRLEELRRAGSERPETTGKNELENPAEAPGTIEAGSAVAKAAAPPELRKARTGMGTGATAPRLPPSGSRQREDQRRVSIDLSHLAAKGIVTPDAPRSQM